MSAAELYPQGLPLSIFTETLTRVPDEHNACPRAAIADLPERLGPHVMRYVSERFGDREPLEKHLHHLPMKAFARLTSDELAKIKYSSFLMMDDSVRKALEQEPRFFIIEKIRLSMWHWGFAKDSWNDVVDAYEAIRNFDVGIPGMEVRFDHSTSWMNRRGHSEYTQTFLDGEFGFLLYYRGEHVMTLGFSVSGKRRILLQQVQLKKPKGNRWLFKLPSNRLEFFIDAFRRNFPGHLIYLADGAQMVGESIASYGRGLDEARSTIARIEARLARDLDPDEREEEERWLARAVEKRDAFAEKLAHAKADLPRLTAFYEDTGKYHRGQKITVSGFAHYRMLKRRVPKVEQDNIQIMQAA